MKLVSFLQDIKIIKSLIKISINSVNNQAFKQANLIILVDIFNFLYSVKLKYHSLIPKFIVKHLNTI